MATPEVAIFYGLLGGRESQIGIGHLTVLDQALAAIVAMNLAVAFIEGLSLEFVLRGQVVILGGCRLACPRLAVGGGSVLIALAIGRWKVRVCVGVGLDVTGGRALVDASGLGPCSLGLAARWQMVECAEGSIKIGYQSDHDRYGSFFFGWAFPLNVNGEASLGGLSGGMSSSVIWTAGYGFLDVSHRNCPMFQTVL